MIDMYVTEIRGLQQVRYISNEGLAVLREQLQILETYVAATPTPIWYHDSFWWLGDFPASPEIYNPSDWERYCPTINECLIEYCMAVRKEIIDLQDSGWVDAVDTLRKYLDGVDNLPISDLLTTRGSK